MSVALKVLRKVYQMTGANNESVPKVHYSGQSASDVIADGLKRNDPFLVARIGATEFNCISGYLNSKKGFEKYVAYINGSTNNLKLDDDLIKQAFLWSGIFPAEKSIIEKFALLSLEDLKEVDVLGLWLKERQLLESQLKSKKLIPLKDIEPYYHSDPWSKELSNKRVLVIHPFTESIKAQFSKREKLYENSEILPDFELVTLKAVQSIAGNNVNFSNWFDALDHMKDQIDRINFDVAILGCGAYGLSLGAHIKRIGKKAIHMGGATQILFGIKGARWDNHPTISKLYNEHWSRPLDSETPKDKDKVEEGCYW